MKALAETLSKKFMTAQLAPTSNQTNMISLALLQASYSMVSMPGYGAMYGGMPSVNYNVKLIQGNSWLPGKPGFFSSVYGYQPFVSMPGLMSGNVKSSINPTLHQVPASNIIFFVRALISINNYYLNLQQVQNDIMGTNLKDLQSTRVLEDGTELLQNKEIVVIQRTET